MKKTVLRSYAKLIATMGVNVQKGQEVFIVAELDQPEFVKMVAEECYRAGAKRVVVDWNYQPLDKIQVRWRKPGHCLRLGGSPLEALCRRDPLPHLPGFRGS